MSNLTAEPDRLRAALVDIRRTALAIMQEDGPSVDSRVARIGAMANEALEASDE